MGVLALYTLSADFLMEKSMSYIVCKKTLKWALRVCCTPPKVLC